MTDSRETANPGSPAALAAANPIQARRPWMRTSLMVGFALVGGTIGGTGGFALAAGPWAGGWHHGPRLEMIQHIAMRTLDSVGATSAQEDKIHDIIAKTFTDLAPDPAKRGAMRKQALDLLRAATVDRAAVEKLRADQVASFDTKSKAVVSALLDAADALTPEQRGKLADRLEAMAEHHHGFHGSQGGWTGAPGRDEMDRDHGPDGGPDHGPDKG